MEIVVRVEGWEWARCEFGHYALWTARDLSGASWIVKFTGSFYSYREWVFGRLASRLGLNVREARLAWISKQDLLQTGQKKSGSFQLLLRFIERHGDAACSSDCPFPKLRTRLNEENDICAFLVSVDQYNAADCIVKDFLADIFGANETSECLFGVDHKFYIIDNEQMFSTKSTGKISAPWLFARDRTHSAAGHKLLMDLCRKIVSLTDSDLRDISKCPDGYRVDALWSILPILRRGKQVAQSILENGPVYY
jgi:hypothetical protein